MRKRELPDEVVSKLAERSPHDLICIVNALAPVLTALRHEAEVYKTGPVKVQSHEFLQHVANYTGQIQCLEMIIAGFRDALDESSFQMELFEREKTSAIVL